MHISIHGDTYRRIISNVLKERQEKNSSYSLRAFARDLESSPSSLSPILNGKRPLALEKAMSWAIKLKLEGDLKKTFLEAVHQDSYIRLNPTEREARKIKEKYDYYQLKLDGFRLISDWYHLAILNLTVLEGFVSDDNWIAGQLGISRKEAGEAIARLLRLELLSKADGKLIRTEKAIETPTDLPSEAIRDYHRQNISRAMDTLETHSIEERDITSIMMPVDKSKISEAKKKIQNFRKELAAFLKSGKSEQVYSLNIQLFPQNNGSFK